MPEYPLHILDLNEVTDYSAFRTELRTVFELYRCRKNKKEFKKYLENHEECRHLDEESCRISQGIIETCKEFGCSKEEITIKLMKRLTIFKSEAEQYVEIYMKN